MSPLEKLANLVGLFILLIFGIQWQAYNWGIFPVLDPLVLIMPVLITFQVFLAGEAIEYWRDNLRDLKEKEGENHNE